MNGEQIGRLERVPLREVWKHEANDFTQWLEQNIDTLNDALDLNIVSVDREQAAGSFSVDLVGEDEGIGRVIIENQLEKSNHDHLGKLITYLAMIDARAAIWIVSAPRPEHVAAMTWLNEARDANFYLVKVEAVRISDSPAAPLFTLIVGPSEESKEIGKTKIELAERENIRKEWWTSLIDRSGKVNKLHSHLSPSIHAWIGASSGIRGLTLNYVVFQHDVAAELYIDRGKDSEAENKSIFDHLFTHKGEIESQFGEPLSWQRLDGKRACRIRFTRPIGGYRSPEEEWPKIQDSAINDMHRLEQALRPILKQLRIDGARAS